MLNGGKKAHELGWQQYAAFLSNKGAEAKYWFGKKHIEFLNHLNTRFLNLLAIQLEEDGRAKVGQIIQEVAVGEAIVLAIQDHAIGIYRSARDGYFWCDSEIGIYKCDDEEAILDVILQPYYRDFFSGALQIYFFTRLI